MATVLIVDDAEFDRCLAGGLLEEGDGFTLLYAADGQEALAVIRRESPDLVLTDLQMPVMNGLQLVETIRRDFPSLPVVLMTAHGSEEIAVTALQKGAASYVPKRNLARDLVDTVETVLKLADTTRSQREVLGCLIEAQYRYVLSNDLSLLLPLVGHFQDGMTQLKIVEKRELLRVGTALFEVLVNAIEHGNLEIRSEQREGSRRLTEQRRQLAPYQNRRVYVTATFSPSQAVFVVRDEGPGFDPSLLPDPTDPANLEKASGRGLLLVRTFMDDVAFNAAGNQITLVKRRK